MNGKERTLLGIYGNLGGCFGTGPGKLKLSDPRSFVLNFTSEGMSVNETYQLKAKITTDVGKIDEIVRTVEVIVGNPPKISISSLNERKKFAASYNITLVANCKECPNPDLITYNWSLTEVSPVNNNIKRNINLTGISDARQTYLTILGKKLKGGHKYEITVYIGVIGRTPGKAIFEFSTIFPPFGGKCNIHPASGYALETTFQVRCTDWVNSEDESNLHYEVFISEGGYKRELLTDGINTTQTIDSMKIGTGPNYTHLLTYSVMHPDYLEFVSGHILVQVLPLSLEDNTLAETMALYRNYTKKIELQFEQGMHKEAIQKIRSVYQLLTTVIATETSTNDSAMIQDQVEDLIDILDFGIEDSLDTTLDLAIPEYVAKTVDFMLDEASVLTPDAYDHLLLLSEMCTDATKRIIPITDPAPEVVVTAMIPIVESIGKVVDAIESTSSDANMTEPTQFVNILEESIDKATDDARTILSKTVQADGQQLTVDTPSLSMTISRASASDLGKAIKSNGTSFKMPNADYSDLAQSFIMSIIEYKPNEDHSAARYSYSNSSKNIGTTVSSIDLCHANGSVIPVHNMSEYIVIDLQINNNALPNVTNLMMDNSSNYITHMFTVEDTSLALFFIIRTEDSETEVNAYIKQGETAWSNNYDIMTKIPHPVSTEYITVSNETLNEMQHTFFVPQATVKKCGIGTYYLTIIPIGLEEDMTTEALQTSTFRTSTTSITPYRQISFIITSSASVCRYWNKKNKIWDDKGCYVSRNSFSDKTRCLCNHLTTFGADFVVPPNTIDFDTVFVNMDDKISDNYAVLTFICIVFGVYVMIALYSRRKDRHDIVKWGVTALKDNLLNEKFLYEITVHTGLRSGAGTKSNVSFVLCGDGSDTGVRNLTDGKKKGFARGTVVRYVMTSAEHLGNLQHMRIWHDNSGKGADGGWYANKIIVQDLKTGQTSIFLVNQWLAVEEDDGLIDRVVTVASYDQLTKFGSLFADISRKKMTDGHLWVSVFSRPDRSYFTRVQRASVILSLLFLTMVVNAMFYGRDENVKVQNITFGPFRFNTFQLWVSFIGSIIVIPPSMIIDHLFRKSKPKPAKVDTLKKPMTIEGPTDDDIADDRPKLKKTKSKMLPHWCRYIAWLLVFLATAASSFFMFLYSIQWGKEKSEEWLMSMIFSIGQSVFIIQPVKVLVIAAIISAIFRKPTFSEVDDDEDPEMKIRNAFPADDEEMMQIKTISGKRKKIAVEPMDPELMIKARAKRLREMEMMAVLKDICFYLIFLSLLVYIVQQNRDKNAYYVNDNHNNVFIDLKYNSINNVEKLWIWMESTMVNGLYYQKPFYDETTRDLRKDVNLLYNEVSLRVGPPRIRQLRIKTNQCKVHPIMKNISAFCNSEYSILKEDKESYLEGWDVDISNTSAVNEDEMVKTPWMYQDMFDLGGLPYWGFVTTYNGGGYAAYLRGSSHNRIQRTLSDLKTNGWIDAYSRAIFIEFSVYNPNVNIFTRVQFLFEQTNVGTFFKSHLSETLQLYSYLGASAYFTVCCHLSLIGFLIFFLVREIKKLVKERKAYFKEFWNLMEFSKLVLGVTAIAMYIMKNIYVYVILDDLATKKDKFINFQRLAIWNETFIIVAAFVSFISLLQILNLLRFNSTITMLGMTLKTSLKELTTFSFTFFIIFLAFAQFAYLAFSATLSFYSTFVTTIESLLSHLFGQIDFDSMSMAYGSFGLLYYVAFVLVASFILLNMFVSILNDVMTNVKEEKAKKVDENDQYNLLIFVWKMVQDTIGIDIDGWFKRPRNSEINKKLIDIEKNAERQQKDQYGQKLPQDDDTTQQTDTKDDVFLKRTVTGMEAQIKTLHKMVGSADKCVKKYTNAENDPEKVKLDIMEAVTDVLFLDNPTNMSTKQQMLVYHAAKVAIFGIGAQLSGNDQNQ